MPTKEKDEEKETQSNLLSTVEVDPVERLTEGEVLSSSLDDDEDGGLKDLTEKRGRQKDSEGHT